MRKFLLLLLISSTFLASCNTRELSFNRTYPDEASLDVLRQEKAAELLALQNSTGFQHLVESSTLPNKIHMTLEDGTELPLTHPLQLCWRKTFEECSQVAPINIHERNLTPQDERMLIKSFTVEANTQISLNTYIISEVPMPDRLEFYQLELDGSLTPYEFQAIDQYNYIFMTPSENNTHTLIVKSIFERQIGGIAYYVLRITT
jgi:hypothetical protein